MTPDELSERIMTASVRAGRVVDALPNTKLGNHVATQLVSCGTSFGPNYEEDRAAESRADFIHKLKVSLKELRETKFWLIFSVRSELLPATRLNDLIAECHELMLILTKSISTARDNLRKEKEARKRNRKSSSDDQPLQTPNT
jgi:four helix bundle protein